MIIIEKVPEGFRATRDKESMIFKDLMDAAEWAEKGKENADQEKKDT